MTCKNCIHYEKGFDGKPGTCTIPLADVWNGFGNLKNDGAGISVENFEPETNVLYVGENFGCIHFQNNQP